MYKYLLMSGAILFSCNERRPEVIQERFFLDTIKVKDSIEVNPDFVVPKDRTAVEDTVEPKVGPMR
ncbi:MAG: hypothetical protein ACK40G_16310 [Cytophagaceae bacterium]